MSKTRRKFGTLRPRAPRTLSAQPTAAARAELLSRTMYHGGQHEDDEMLDSVERRANHVDVTGPCGTVTKLDLAGHHAEVLDLGLHIATSSEHVLRAAIDRANLATDELEYLLETYPELRAILGFREPIEEPKRLTAEDLAKSLGLYGNVLHLGSNVRFIMAEGVPDIEEELDSSDLDPEYDHPAVEAPKTLSMRAHLAAKRSKRPQQARAS